MQAAYIAEPRDYTPPYHTIDYVGKPIANDVRVDEWTQRARQLAKDLDYDEPIDTNPLY